MGRKTWYGVGVLALGLLVHGLAWAGEIRVYANREIKPAVLQLIERAERTVDVQMYAFTAQDVIRALQAARSRGITVRVLLDPNQSANLKNVEQLTNRWIEVTWAPVSLPAIMHRKLLIVDGSEVLLGLANWTHNAFTRSYEVDVLLDDVHALQQLQHLFDRDWQTGWLGREAQYSPAVSHEP